MMRCYHIDSFTKEIFTGNPACVVPLDAWLPDEMMQRIAAENNVAATALFIKAGADKRFYLRWFTPVTELPLCAHASLAAALVICEEMHPDLKAIVFDTASGDLSFEQIAPGRYRMNFPIDPYEETPIDRDVSSGLGLTPVHMLRARYSVAIYEHEDAVRSLAPDFAAIRDCRHAKRPGAVVATAPAAGRDYDFVSRFFAPGVGVNEDPVTGSAHCILAAYWSDQLGRAETIGYQASKRGGIVKCRTEGDRVWFTGDAVFYSKGNLQLDLG